MESLTKSLLLWEWSIRWRQRGRERHTPSIFLSLAGLSFSSAFMFLALQRRREKKRGITESNWICAVHVLFNEPWEHLFSRRDCSAESRSPSSAETRNFFRIWKSTPSCVCGAAVGRRPAPAVPVTPFTARPFVIVVATAPPGARTRRLIAQELFSPVALCPRLFHNRIFHLSSFTAAHQIYILYRARAPPVVRMITGSSAQASVILAVEGWWIWQAGLAWGCEGGAEL